MKIRNECRECDENVEEVLLIPVSWDEYPQMVIDSLLEERFLLTVILK